MGRSSSMEFFFLLALLVASEKSARGTRLWLKSVRADFSNTRKLLDSGKGVVICACGDSLAQTRPIDLVNVCCCRARRRCFVVLRLLVYNIVAALLKLLGYTLYLRALMC